MPCLTSSASSAAWLNDGGTSTPATIEIDMSSSQKFIARNRAPRVQIEYDLDLNGAQKKVQLPFIMGVMSDLAGKSETEEAKRAVADRKFLEIDVDNFNNRMEALKPRVAFAVPNTLTGEGSLQVDVSFESMEDFSPAAIAKKVDSLSKLMEARTQLSSLLTYMDGKNGAEELLAQVMKDPDILKTIALAPKSEQDAKKSAE
jgi:type VI secretion system protein ImpB